MTGDVRTIFDTLPVPVILVNREGVIQQANPSFTALTPPTYQMELVGKRPGDVLGCLHAVEYPNGCGSTPYCKACGTNIAIIRARDGIESWQTCNFLADPSVGVDSREFKVWAKPIHLGESQFTFLAMLDISDEKRRRMLERIFFHDVLNSMNVLLGFISLLRDRDDLAKDPTVELIHQTAMQVFDEIIAQQQLNAAENKELIIEVMAFTPGDLLEDVLRPYRRQASSHGVNIELEPTDALRRILETDRTLLRRVLINAVKNALEASSPGDRIRMLCAEDEGGIRFDVSSSSPLPEEVQLMVFKRSFSTKGAGRGLGTYSMKLLSERFLQGKVWFESSSETGTTFSVWLPLAIQERSDRDNQDRPLDDVASR